MLPAAIEKANCPRCSEPLELHVFEPAKDGHVKYGIARCNGCNSGYPVDDELLLLTVPQLMPGPTVQQFMTKFHTTLAPLKVSVLADNADTEAERYLPQRGQRDHFDSFATNRHQDYTRYAQTPFWKAADRIAFHRWRPPAPAYTWLLDVGCANGRATFPMVTSRVKVVGLDLSETLLRQAIQESYANRTHPQVSFLLADADRLPFRDNSFDRLMTYGVLHHLPDPAKACKDFQRVLSGNGVYLGSENNDSPMRPLFDLLMRLRPLWREKAGSQPLISRARLEAWHEGTDAIIRERYSVYLPPHLYNLTGDAIAFILMYVTDSLFNTVPFIRRLGGLIVYEIHSGHK